jgi:hypothetical protein
MSHQFTTTWLYSTIPKDGTLKRTILHQSIGTKATPAGRGASLCRHSYNNLADSTVPKDGTLMRTTLHQSIGTKATPAGRSAS